ncbi:MAG: hypothetical protein PF439_02980 [Helicobacteraceae bacterium]|nr:hypothetical protein [Helicobacteraceae bacterium]
MDLAKIAHNIALAKQDNARWLEYADALISGYDIDKKYIPSYRDHCIPFEWLSAHSDELSHLITASDEVETELLHFDIMEQIEILRYDLHESYNQIVKTYFPELNNFFFSNLFFSVNPASKFDLLDAKKQFMEMKRIAAELDKKLDNLEQSMCQLCRFNIAL